MASPLLVLFVSSLFTGFLATLLVVVAVCVDSWQYESYDWTLLKRLNDSCKSRVQNECRIIEVSTDPVLFRYEEFSDSWPGNETHFLYSTYSGLWRTCDHLTDELRNAIIKEIDSSFKWGRCFTYVTDYNDESDLLPKGSKQIARLQNSAASCYIVVLIDLCSAAVVGILGLIHKQVASCMITGVLYLMAALFGIFGLSMFHTKDYYEKYYCYAIDEIPTRACSARTVTVGCGVPLAWIGVVACILACGIWLFVSRVLRMIRIKTML